MLVMSAFRALVLTAAAIGCGEDPARVSIVPVERSCLPALPNQLAITAYAEGGQTTRAVGVDRAVDIGDFPIDTKQLAIEILIGGGVAGAIGKTAPLELDALANGTEVPVFMAAPDRRCTVGAMTEPRTTPLVARAGAGALVVGGIGPSGPLSSAEFYDPTTGTFTPVALPDAFADDVNGLAGAVLATLPDGRVVLSGGSRGLFAVFDPETREFGAALALAPQRAFHGAVASPRGVIMAGGCAGVQSQACLPTPLRSVIEYGIDGDSIETGPNLALDAVAEGAQLFDLGNAYVLAGGFGTAGEAHRFAFADRDATKLTNLHAQAISLDGGALLTAFFPDGAPATDRASEIVTPAGSVVTVAAPITPLIEHARMVALEDGSVLAFGALGEVARFDPTSALWDVLEDPVAPAPPQLAAPAVVRLADGSVLEVGRESPPAATAHIFRPSLVGPMAGSVTAQPAIEIGDVLVPSDPSTLTRGELWILTAPDDTLSARALVGGPRMRSGSVAFAGRIEAGGLALIAQQTAPDRALVAHVVPGEAARLEQLGEGTVCSGELVPASVTSATLVVRDGVEVRISDTVVLACSYEATAIGQWGVAASGAGARIAVGSVAVER